MQKKDDGVITLLWPPRELHPNSRTHWAAKARTTKQYRAYAAAVTRQSGVQVSGGGLIDVWIIFYPPSKARRDLDGMLSSIKAGLDGIADALEVDDCRFRPRIDLGDVQKGGVVKITIFER